MSNQIEITINKNTKSFHAQRRKDVGTSKEN